MSAKELLALARRDEGMAIFGVVDAPCRNDLRRSSSSSATGGGCG